MFTNDESTELEARIQLQLKTKSKQVVLVTTTNGVHSCLQQYSHIQPLK